MNLAPDKIIWLAVVGSLALLAGLAWLGRNRRGYFEPHASRDRVFRCGQCQYVYTDDEDVNHSRCPQCGELNGHVEF